MPRAYDMSKRATRAAQTTEQIAVATEVLLASVPIAEITLQAVAERAGVTVQTVLRHMGSRDGCFDAVGERIGARIDAQRGGAEPGDLGGAISGLLAHYEAEGRLVLNLLVQDQRGGDPLAARFVAEGRAYHRAWVERSFAPQLAGRGRRDKRELVDALVAATDLYVWKLLRLDLGRSAAATAAIIERLVGAALTTPEGPCPES
jgi:AcrR family transcriptional regulator